MKDEPIRMSKSMVECFVATMKYNNSPIEVLLVPLFNGQPGWVGPGFWKPRRTDPKTPVEPPKFDYNTRVYSRQELLAAGAKPKFEHLWMR